MEMLFEAVTQSAFDFSNVEEATSWALKAGH